MHLRIEVKSPNNISKWQVGFNSAFKGIMNLSRLSGCPKSSQRDAPLSVFLIFLRANLLKFRLCSPVYSVSLSETASKPGSDHMSHSAHYVAHINYTIKIKYHLVLHTCRKFLLVQIFTTLSLLEVI
jgi:hypothetical protein